MFQDTWVKYWFVFLIGHQSSWMKGSSDNLNFGWIFNRWGSPGFYCGVWKKWAHLIIWTVWIFNRRLQPLAFCIFSRWRSSRFQQCQAHLSIREQWWRGVEGLWAMHQSGETEPTRRLWGMFKHFKINWRRHWGRSTINLIINLEVGCSCAHHHMLKLVQEGQFSYSPHDKTWTTMRLK